MYFYLVHKDIIIIIIVMIIIIIIIIIIVTNGNDRLLRRKVAVFTKPVPRNLRGVFVLYWGW